MSKLCGLSISKLLKSRKDKSVSNGSKSGKKVKKCDF